MAPFNHQHGKDYGKMHLVAVQRPPRWQRWFRSLDLEREDLFAIPLCLLLGFGFMVYSLGVGGLLHAVQASPVGQTSDAGAIATVVSLLSVPAAAVRQWFS